MKLPLFPLALVLGVASPAMADASVTEASLLHAQLERAENAMLDDPRDVMATAISVEMRARRFDQGIDRDRLLAKTLWLQGEAAGRIGDVPKAERSLAQALTLIKRSDPQSQLHARIVMSSGGTALDEGEVQSAFTSFRDAFAMFQKLGDTRGQALALQSMGNIYIDAGDYRRVLQYYAQSADIHPGDHNLTMSAFINQGLAFKELGQFDASLRDYGRGLALARETGSASYQVTILLNLAEVELARGRTASAARYDERALATARVMATEKLPLAWGTKARIAWARNDPAAAVAMLQRAIGQTPLTATNYQFRPIHQMASEAYLKLGNPALALEHLRAVNRLDAKVREIRSSANAALMAAQFDYSSQELRIARRDVALAANRARTQWIMLGGSLLLLVASLIAFFWIRRSRNETRAVNVQLGKALAAKSEFLATTSHEIRTPLNGIMGMTQVLLSSPGVEPAVRERIGLIDGAGKAMKAIVDDLLDMAKIEAGEVTIERSEVALPSLLDETVRLWAAEADAKGVKVSAETSQAPDLIIEDERKLRQVLFNLVSNAVKFTARGHVTVTATAEGDRLLIRVEDSGIGIPPDQQAAIFEAFHQVDGATTRQHSGTGLGLAIASKLASQLGGGIAVESHVGRGSCFSLDLPLTLAAPRETPAAADGPLSLSSARVLLVDRNPLFQSLAAAALDGIVGSLATADSFADALGMGAFDVLIVDRATLGEAPLDMLASAAATSRVLTLLPPGEAAGDGHAVIAKQMPPLNIGPVLQDLFEDAPQTRMAA